MPEVRDWLIMRVSGCTIICLICFSNLLEILSIPELVLFGRFVINVDKGVHVYRCTNVGLQVYGCTGVYNCTGVQVYGCTSLRVYKCKDVQVYKCLGVQMHRCKKV